MLYKYRKCAFVCACIYMYVWCVVCTWGGGGERGVVFTWVRVCVGACIHTCMGVCSVSTVICRVYTVEPAC